MSPDRYRKIGEIYHTVVESPLWQRPALLDRECAGDDQLRREVESLLDSNDLAESFLTAPAMEVAARLLAADPDGPREGTSIGRYRLLSRLGAGGMGEVFLAEDTQLDRKVAIKFLSPETANDEGARLRLLREARAAARLDHPNICAVHEVGSSDACNFIVMQYVEGESLRCAVGGAGLALDHIVAIARQIGSALAAAHAEGVVHRDLKSSNVILSERGKVTVLDFGLARFTERDGSQESGALTATGAVMGTPRYMSPEQARGEVVDLRSDIFSFGVVLYEMATGQVPFKRASSVETMAAVINEPHRPLWELRDDLPEALVELVDRALAKAPEDRYQSVHAMLDDLAALAAGAPLGDRVAPSRTFDVRIGRRRVKNRWRSRLALPVAATVAAVATLIALFYVFERREPAPAAALTRIRSIAVLPFKPLVVDSRDEPLEMGMADTLITRLSNIRAVAVRPITAVRKYGALDQDPLVAGREQGVDAVLDGSIQKSAERIRVTVRLTTVADGRQIWSGQFEEKLSDIFAVQDSIASRVSAALAPELSGDDERRLAKRDTQSLEAYEHYVKGRYFAAKWTPEGFEKGIDSFERAIAIDPSYALAYDGLAYCHYNTFYRPFRQSMTIGRAMASRALEIDPALAEAHVSLGLIHTWLDYDWKAAEREFRHAIDLKPNYAPAHIWYGWYLQTVGRSEEAIAEMRRGVELDPVSAEAGTGLGVALFYARRYDDAAVQLRKTLDLEPDFWFARLYLGRALRERGDRTGAIAELETARRTVGASAEVLSALGYTYGVAGRAADARRMMLELRRSSTESYLPPYCLAVLHTGLGERDLAFAQLDREYREGAYYLNLLKVDPELDALRADPRFDGLLRRIQLTT